MSNTIEQEIIDYLDKEVFNPVLRSPVAPNELKSGVRLTRLRMPQRDAKGMMHYYWSAIIGTERSTPFAKRLKAEGFTKFEEIIDDFRDKCNTIWAKSK
jgi:hypothetical protein